MAKPELMAIIANNVRPMWEQLIASTPEVLADGMTFEDFCNEVRLSI